MSAVAANLIGAVVVAAISGLFVWLGRQADAKATQDVAAQARSIEARKVDLEEFREMQNRLDVALDKADAKIEKLSDDLAAERTARVRSDIRAEAAERRATRAEDRVDQLAATLAAHGQWDLLVLAEVRKSSPDFPDPPPLAVAP